MPAVPTTIDAQLADLDAADRGFVLGVLIAGTADAGDSAAVLALASPAGERCADAIRTIAALPRPERMRLLGLFAREALAPLPAGIEDVHPDALREVLRDESVETIRLITANGPSVLRAVGAAVIALRGAEEETLNQGDQAQQRDQKSGTAPADAVADLQRAVLAPIVAVPPLPPGVEPRRFGRKLTALAPAALLTALTGAGADLLGASLRGADEETLKRAAAHTGAPWAERIVGAARAGAGSTDAATECSRDRARILVAATTPTGDPRQILERLGARAFGDRLQREDPDLALAVAQRLPSDLARELLAAVAL